MRHLVAAYLRHGAKVSAVFALITALGALALIGAPAFQRHLFEAETAHTIDSMPERSRALIAQMVRPGGKVIYPDPSLAEVFAPMQELSFPGGLANTLGEAQYSIETEAERPFFSEAPMPAELWSRGIGLIADSEAQSSVSIVEGHWPGPQLAGTDPEEAVIDVAISSANAGALGLNVGDELLLPGHFTTRTVKISGVFEPLDGSSLIWQIHPRALTPFIDDDPNVGKTAAGAAFINPDTPGWLGESPSGSLVLRGRLPMHGSALQADTLATDLLTFTSARHLVIDGEDPLEFTSSLSLALADLLAQREAATPVLATIVTGPLGAVIAVSILMALISRQRRRREHALMFARGASTLQLRALGALEGAVIGLPALVVGIVLGSPLLGIGVALFPALGLALAPLRPNPSPRRRALTLSLALVVSAGLAWASYYAGSRLGGNDPLAVIQPVTITLVIALVTTALIPLVMGVLHRASARGRGLPRFLGSARAARQLRPGWAVVALVVAVGSAIFASTTLATIDHGARANAYQTAGADVRLNTGWLDAEQQAELAAVPGVTGATAVQVLMSTRVGSEGDDQRVTVFMVDTEQLHAAQANFPGARDLRALGGESSDGIPVFTSPGLFSSGSITPAVHLHEWLPVTVVGEARGIPGVVDSSTWMILDRRSLSAEATDLFPPPRLMLFATDGTGETAEAIHATGGGVVTTSLGALDRFTASPVVSGLSALAWGSLGFAAALAAVATVLFLMLGAPERRYTGGIVAILGGRVSAGLAAWEATPVAIGGIFGGVGAGLALPYLVKLDLRTFTGGMDAPDIVVDPWRAALVIGIVIAAVLGSVGLGALASARSGPQALRMGD